MNTYTTFRVIFLAVVISLAMGPLAARLARLAGLVDVPGSAPHKHHESLVPVAGGIVLFLTFLLVSFVEGLYKQPSIPPLLVIPVIVFLFGLLDDRKGLSPFWKFVGQIIATVILIYTGTYIRLFHQNWLNYGLTLFWMVGVTNAYNFVDSMDGLAVGLAAMAAAFFMLVTVESLQFNLSLFSTILLGACLGSFYFNAPPARLFLGDAGSQFLGFVLAALGIAYNPIGFSPLASWYVPILLVGVPIFDAALVIFSRLRRGKPIYQAALDHTFHRLVILGMSSNRAVLTMHIAALILGSLAFLALDQPPAIANGIFITVFIIGVIGVLFLDTRKTITTQL